MTEFVAELEGVVGGAYEGRNIRLLLELPTRRAPSARARARIQRLLDDTLHVNVLDLLQSERLANVELYVRMK